jgi:hypothetical protein
MLMTKYVYLSGMCEIWDGTHTDIKNRMTNLNGFVDLNEKTESSMEHTYMCVKMVYSVTVNFTHNIFHSEY